VKNEKKIEDPSTNSHSTTHQLSSNIDHRFVAVSLHLDVDTHEIFIVLQVAVFEFDVETTLDGMASIQSQDHLRNSPPLTHDTAFPTRTDKTVTTRTFMSSDSNKFDFPPQNLSIFKPFLEDLQL
jgi:hypothetical protein